MSLAQTSLKNSLSRQASISLGLERLRRKAKPKQKLHTRFQQTYYNDWVALVNDCVEWRGQRPTSYQNEILAEFQKHRRIAVRGPHGLGKTTLAAWIVLSFALTRDGEDWKVPTTASSWRQLSKFLWPEIHKWARRLKWSKIGRGVFNSRTELLTLNLKLTTGEAFAVASDKPDLIEGAHADQILYLFDESKAIPDDTFDAAEGAFSGAGIETNTEAYALAISTPGEPIGRFYDIHRRKPGYEDWWVRHVKLNEAIQAGRISREWAEQRRRQWGESSAVYQNRVVGEFAANDEDSVIPLAWIELANERWLAWKEKGFPGRTIGNFVGVGADIGGGGPGADKTILSERYKPYLFDELRKDDRGDPNVATMRTTGKIKGILDAKGGVAIIDNLGIGLGVFHRLREQGYTNALAFSASQKAVRIIHNKEYPIKDKTDEFGFIDKRSAAWWLFRELLDPANGEDIALPPDDQLTGELMTPKWNVHSGAKIKVESKDKIRDRIKRSTDCADAVIEIATGIEMCEKPLNFIGIVAHGRAKGWQ